MNKTVREISASNCHLYMKYNKILPSAQGMAIYGNMAFVLYHTGVCAVYDLVSRKTDAAAVFKLGSYNEGVPSKEHLNHGNQCMFSDVHYGNNPLPLLYVTTGNGAGEDENGEYYRCCVENITIKRTNCGQIMSASSETVQVISYKSSDAAENMQWEKVCWGCPAWFVDSSTDSVYIFSSKYRTTKEFLKYYKLNRYIVTRFSMPDPTGNRFVTLGPADIEDQFSLPFDILFTQGGTLKDNKIYYTFGLGTETYHLGLRVIDLKNKCLSAGMDLSRSVFSHEEIECCAFYRGELLCNTNSEIGSIYSLGKMPD